MKQLTKQSFTDLYNQIDKWNITVPKMYISSDLYEEIKAWGKPLEDQIVEHMKHINSEEEKVKNYFVAAIKTGRGLDVLRRVVETHYPHYLELLDKYLILK